MTGIVRHIPLPVNSIRRHHIAHHNPALDDGAELSTLTYPVADWFFGTSDLTRGLLRHVFQWV